VTYGHVWFRQLGQLKDQLAGFGVDNPSEDTLLQKDFSPEQELSHYATDAHHIVTVLDGRVIDEETVPAGTGNTLAMGSAVVAALEAPSGASVYFRMANSSEWRTVEVGQAAGVDQLVGRKGT